MKRFIVLFAVLICMAMILPLTVFAGDIPESLLYEEGAQIFFGEVNPTIRTKRIRTLRYRLWPGSRAM